MPGWDSYTKVKQIGRGAFGAAWLIKRKKDQMPLVCKEVNMKNVSKQEREKIFEEVEVLRKLRHENIVELHEAFTYSDSLNIIMEYADGGDLDKMIRNAKGTRIEEPKIVDIFTQICKGVSYVHSLRILHRDLKGANILITKGGVIKLCDFGVARAMSPDTNFALTQIGTPYYLSPEICEGKPYDARSDVWSLGCVLYELCTLRRPFEADGLPALIVKIVRGKYAPIPTHYSRDMRHLVDIMIQVNTAMRASVDDVMAQPIIQQHLKEVKTRAGDAALERHPPDPNRKVSLPPPLLGAGGVVGNRSRPGSAESRPEPDASEKPPKEDRSVVGSKPPPPGMRRLGSAKAGGGARPTIAALKQQAPLTPSSRQSPSPYPSPSHGGSPLARRDSPERNTPQGISPVPARRPANREAGAAPASRSRSRSPESAPRSRRSSKDEVEGDFRDAIDVAGLPKNVTSAFNEQDDLERELAKLIGKGAAVI